MATANTIGRIVGQAPESEAETEDSNPLAKMKEIFDKAKGMYDKIKDMVEKFKQLAEARREEESGASAGDADDEESPSVETPEELRERLTALGDSLRVRPGSMEGPPRPDQVRTREITMAILDAAMSVSRAPGASVHALDLADLTSRISEFARAAPSPEQATQAVDNAATMARLRGAKPQVLEVIQSVYEVVKAAMDLLKGLKPQPDGAQIKE